MKDFLNLKYLLSKAKQYIFIFLTATFFSLILFSKVLSQDNVFVTNDVKVKQSIDVNFSRYRVIDKAFLSSFKILMSKILLSSDFKKIKNIKLNKIKSLVNNFQIVEETYRNNIYSAKLNFFYDERRVKKILQDKNISFTQPENISVVLYPVLIVNEKTQDLEENFFYNNWNEILIENELINFILPLEDLDDLERIRKIKGKIEELNVQDIIKKYNTKNYVFLLIQNNNYKLDIYIKSNFNENRISKNFSYEINNYNNKDELSEILKDIKIKITDIWKGENIINLDIPLSITIKHNYKNINNLNKLKNALYKISIINKFSMNELNSNYVFFKIYYYGNPKKLKKELEGLGYNLKNNQGNWEIYNG